jgi:hypothetical protein
MLTVVLFLDARDEKKMDQTAEYPIHPWFDAGHT